MVDGSYAFYFLSGIIFAWRYFFCLSSLRVRFMLGCDFEQNSLFILGYETRSSTQIFDVGVGDVDSDLLPFQL